MKLAASAAQRMKRTEEHGRFLLNDAVFYEIYPQSFYDSNGDGIGDIPGIIEKLDYVKSLGCNALWINPCFDSPFKDAGYDVRDYKRVAPRYGTNEDLIHLFKQPMRKEPGAAGPGARPHSEEHPWFQASCQEEPNEYSGRYIWHQRLVRRGDGMPFVSGEAPRNGAYILNFFKCQPALNYGYGQCNQPWQQPAGSRRPWPPGLPCGTSWSSGWSGVATASEWIWPALW